MFVRLISNLLKIKEFINNYFFYNINTLYNYIKID